jgi:hypothetical protein
MAKDAGRFMVVITRGARHFLDSLDFPRIETPIFTDTPLSIRWIELLGFLREGLMRAYTPDGRDACLYARIRQTQSPRDGRWRR